MVILLRDLSSNYCSVPKIWQNMKKSLVHLAFLKPFPKSETHISGPIYCTQSIAKIIWFTQLISLYTLTQQVEAIEASNSISQNQLPWCSAWDTSSLLSKAETQTQLAADLGGRRWRLSACWRPFWLLDAISVSIVLLME